MGVQGLFVAVGLKGHVAQVYDDKGLCQILKPLRGLENLELAIGGQLVHVIEHDDEPLSALPSVVPRNRLGELRLVIHQFRPFGGPAGGIFGMIVAFEASVRAIELIRSGENIFSSCSSS